jgi:hypothetical protein
MSTGRSRYSKIRPKSASEVCTSRPTESSDWIGNSTRVCSVVNATTVPIEIAWPPEAMLSPANQ